MACYYWQPTMACYYWQPYHVNSSQVKRAPKRPRAGRAHDNTTLLLIYYYHAWVLDYALYIYIYVYMYICIYVYTHTRTHTHTYTHTHTHTHMTGAGPGLPHGGRDHHGPRRPFQTQQWRWGGPQRAAQTSWREWHRTCASPVSKETSPQVKETCLKRPTKTDPLFEKAAEKADPLSQERRFISMFSWLRPAKRDLLKETY